MIIIYNNNKKNSNIQHCFKISLEVSNEYRYSYLNIYENFDENIMHVTKKKNLSFYAFSYIKISYLNK